MKRRNKPQHPPIPSNLNQRTHTQDRRYTAKQIKAKQDWLSLKWLVVCILVGWGGYSMGHIIGKTEAQEPIVNASVQKSQ